MYRILNIDFKAKTVKIVKESMQETTAPKPKTVSFDLIDRIFPKSETFGRFDGYDNHLNCSYSEWDEFIVHIEQARSFIVPLNMSGQPDFHNSLLNIVRTTDAIKYTGHQSNICPIEISEISDDRNE